MPIETLHRADVRLRRQHGRLGQHRRQHEVIELQRIDPRRQPQLAAQPLYGPRQIEAARRTIVREMKRRGKVWIRIFPAKPYTHKPPETRMGSGKGNVEYYVAVVKPGRIMFEVGGLDSEIAIQALKNAQYKFSIKTKIVGRQDAGEQA